MPNDKPIKFAPLKGRVIEFLEQQDISKMSFFRKIEISETNLKSRNKTSEFGGDILIKILAAYPDLSAEWLLRGEGEMLKSHQKGEKEKPKNDGECEEKLKSKDAIIEAQAEAINALKESVSILRGKGRSTDAGSGSKLAEIRKIGERKTDISNLVND